MLPGFHLYDNTDLIKVLEVYSSVDARPLAVQFMSSFNKPHNLFDEYLKHLNLNTIKVYIHADFKLNLVRDDLYSYTRSQLRSLLKFSSFHSIDGIVVHPGYRGVKSKPDLKISPSNAIENILRLFNSLGNINVPILIENCPGSSNDMMFGSISDLSILKDQLPDNVFLCFDTCHSYVNGDDISSSFDVLSKHIRLVHFNPIENKVKFGSHSDRHSKGSFLNCDNPSYILDLNYVFNKSLTLDIPLVSECNIGSVIEMCKTHQEYFLSNP